MRRGLGFGHGKGYYNMLPLDSHIHRLSAKGVKTLPDQAKFYNPLWQKNKGKFYRGTSGGKGVGMSGVLGKGLYVTWTEGMASAFANISKEKNNGKAVVEEYQLPKDLKLLDAQSKTMMDTKRGLGVSPLDKIDDPVFAYALTDEIQRKGFDGVISDDVADGIVIFNPEKIKKVKAKTLDAKKTSLLDLKTPTVEILSAKTFDNKFKDDYKEWEQGYATTKIHPDGTTKVYVRDDGNNDYSREGRLLMHELKEIEIFKDLVKNKGMSPDIADEMAHNMNPVTVEGVSKTYEIDPNN